MLQPLGVECSYLHSAKLGLYVYNVQMRASCVQACMDECVVRALVVGLFYPKKIKILKKLFFVLWFVEYSKNFESKAQNNDYWG